MVNMTFSRSIALRALAVAFLKHDEAIVNSVMIYSFLRL